MTVVRPHLQWGVAELGGGRPGRGLRREAAQRALDQRRLLLLRAGRARLPRRGQRARARAAGAARRRRPAARLPPRGLLGLHGHLQGRGRAQRPLGRRARRPGAALAETGAAERRLSRSLVTGAHGFVGSHLARALLRARRRRCGCSTGRRRDSPTSAASGSRASTCSGSASEVELVEADLRDAEAVAAAVEGADSVFHLAAQTIVGVARALAAGDLRGQRARRLERVRGLPHARGRAGRLRLLRQGLRRQPASCPTARTSRCAPAYPYDASKAAADIDRAQLLRTPTACRWRSPASPTSTAAATSTSPA